MSPAEANDPDEADEETGEEGRETEDGEHEQDHEHEQDSEEGYDYFDEEEQEAQWPESWRRPRRDSLAGLLEQDGMRQVEIWLRDEDRPYAEVKGLIKTEFGIETSEAALCRYYQQYLAPVVIARRLRESNRRWRDLPSESLENAVMARARQMSYDEMMKREPDVRRVERLLAMVNGMERRQLARERVQLERRRVEQREPERRSLAEHFALQKSYRDLDKRLNAGDAMADVAYRLQQYKEYEAAVREELQAAWIEGRAPVLPEVPLEISREAEIERRVAEQDGVAVSHEIGSDPEVAKELGIERPEEAEEKAEGLEGGRAEANAETIGEELGNQEIRDGEDEAEEESRSQNPEARSRSSDEEHEQEHEQDYEDGEARAGTQTDGARRSPATSEQGESGPEVESSS